MREFIAVPPNRQYSELPQSGTILAFDFGTKRIGVAVGERECKLAHPLTTINAVETKQRFTAIEQLIQAWHPTLLVVGLPLHMDGTKHELTRLSQRFARRLAGRFNISVVLQDERYTSITASTALHESGVHSKKHKTVLDQIAAQQILQSFFDEHHIA